MAGGGKSLWSTWLVSFISLIKINFLLQRVDVCFYCCSIVPPVMSIKSDQIQGIVGSSVTMTCQASGTPAPKYEFNKVRHVPCALLQ